MIEPSPHVKLAMAAINAYINSGITLDVPEDTPENLLQARAGAFVCLKIDGQLRGCIGTIQPVRRTLAEEIVANAISAATQDPRFFPVSPSEIGHLVCSVDVLSQAEEIPGPEVLDPKIYGVIVESGSRRGLLLPDLEGVDTVEQQVSIARRKAGINSNSPVKLYRFTVNRFE